LNTNISLLIPAKKRLALLLVVLLVFCISNFKVQAQSKAFKGSETQSNCGWIDKGDSVEFVFGQQRMVKISGVEVDLEKRMNEINQVNLAGDFNGWNPDLPRYQMSKAGGTLYKIMIPKSGLGKSGDLKQFKFVLNHKYWVEPSAKATNIFTDKDGNKNLTLKL
jgi:hypothetical protein